MKELERERIPFYPLGSLYIATAAGVGKAKTRTCIQVSYHGGTDSRTGAICPAKCSYGARLGLEQPGLKPAC